MRFIWSTKVMDQTDSEEIPSMTISPKEVIIYVPQQYITITISSFVVAFNKANDPQQSVDKTGSDVLGMKPIQ